MYTQLFLLGNSTWTHATFCRVSATEQQSMYVVILCAWREVICCQGVDLLRLRGNIRKSELICTNYRKDAGPRGYF